ncbi:hypothetical protein ACHAXH_001109 [Discostella pseudostelligera]
MAASASEATPLLDVPEDQQPLLSSSLLDGMTSMLRSGSISKSASHRHRKNNSSLSKGDPITAALRRGGSGVVNNLPPGGIPDEFEPRPIYDRNNNNHEPRPVNGVKRKSSRKGMKHPSVGGGFMEYVVGIGPAFASRSSNTSAMNNGNKASSNSNDNNTIGSLLIPRKAPIKVEPKVHFANERTFLAWLHLVVVLAGASAMIVMYANREDSGMESSSAKLGGQLYGIVLLPVSLAFIVYALWQYRRRAVMIKHHEPGPFIDVVGPTTITSILVLTITAQFCLKLKALMYG